MDLEKLLFKVSKFFNKEELRLWEDYFKIQKQGVLGKYFCLKIISKVSEQVLKSFSGRNNFLEPPVFGFTNSLPHSLKQSIKLTILRRWVLG